MSQVCQGGPSSNTPISNFARTSSRRAVAEISATCLRSLASAAKTRPVSDARKRRKRSRSLASCAGAWMDMNKVAAHAFSAKSLRVFAAPYRPSLQPACRAASPRAHDGRRRPQSTTLQIAYMQNAAGAAAHFLLSHTTNHGSRTTARLPSRRLWVFGRKRVARRVGRKKVRGRRRKGGEAGKGEEGCRSRVCRGRAARQRPKVPSAASSLPCLLQRMKPFLFLSFLSSFSLLLLLLLPRHALPRPAAAPTPPRATASFFF